LNVLCCMMSNCQFFTKLCSQVSKISSNLNYNMTNSFNSFNTLIFIAVYFKHFEKGLFSVAFGYFRIKIVTSIKQFPACKGENIFE